MKLRYYTAISKDYDEIFEAPGVTPPSVSIVYSERAVPLVTREVIEVVGLGKWESKRFKFLDHPLESPVDDWLVWHDGTHTPADVDGFSRFLESVPLEVPLAAYRHSEGVPDCYHETRRCLFHDLETVDVGMPWIQAMMSAGYPQDRGIPTATVLAYRGSEIAKLRAVMGDVLALIGRAGMRDQMFLDFVLWKRDIPWAEIPGHVYHSPFFDFRRHRYQAVRHPVVSRSIAGAVVAE